MTPRKGLTRHDMKQDEFVSWLTHVIVWAEENSKQVVLFLAGAAVLAVAILGFGAWRRSHLDEAYRMLADVQEAAGTPLATEAPGGAESFATASQRAERVIELADSLLAAYSGSPAAAWARYYRAVALLDLGRAEEAAAAAAALSREEGDDELLGGLALMVAAQAEEARGDLPAAIRHYEAAAANSSAGFPAEAALLGQARCLDRQGSTEQALEAYRRLMDEYPGSPLAARAGQKVQELTGTPQGL